jgi:hypothetical protein
MAREDVIRKIQKALALAGNNPSEAEAQTAMLMAQRLMAEHNIHMTEVAEARSVEEKQKIDRMQVDIKEILWWKWELANIVADNFRCHTTKSANRSINFYGLEDDVVLCEMVFVYAMTTIIYLSKKYIRETVEKGQRLRAVPLKNGYIEGFLRGLRHAFRNQVESVGGMALVLVKPEVLVRYVEDRKFGKTAPSRNLTDYDNGAMSAGYQDGLNFNHESKVIKG